MVSDGEPHTKDIWLAHALLPEGWAAQVRIKTQSGSISSIETGVSPTEQDLRLGIGVPGLCNLHSHAFQRAMAGMAEVGGQSADSFWSWREQMYRLMDHLDPDGFQAVAQLAYAEMLEAGFTRVGEFHYLHHDISGAPYADDAEMAMRLVAAAQATGMGLTLLPVFYAHSDFGGRQPLPQQRRFVHDLDHFATLHQASTRAVSVLEDGVIGVAPHSLRAVTPPELAALLEMTNGPVHIHIAEQEREVESCLAWSGQRPVEWLLAHFRVDERWCLVHATHVDATELRAIADSHAVVGLCPITEANLGDGFFPARDFSRLHGRTGIGTDSNVLIDAAQEMRLLEYGQRLLHRGRNVLASYPEVSSGRHLYQSAVEGGAQALGVPPGLCVGAAADIVELDGNHPSLLGASGDAILDRWIFATRQGGVKSVLRRGKFIVEDGRHHHRDSIRTAYARALGRWPAGVQA